jgi:hypothetical protein
MKSHTTDALKQNIAIGHHQKSYKGDSAWLFKGTVPRDSFPE